MRNLNELILPHIMQIADYVPGKPVKEVQRELGLDIEFHKLASNENTIGVSPKALKAIKDNLKDLFWYPEHYAITQRRRSRTGMDFRWSRSAWGMGRWR